MEVHYRWHLGEDAAQDVLAAAVTAARAGDLALVDYAIVGSGPNAGKQIGGYAMQWLTREGSNWRIRMLVANLKPAQDVAGMAATPK